VFKTNKNAPKYKLISIDLNDASGPKWNELVAEKEDVLQYVSCVNKNKLLLDYMHDCKVYIGSFRSLTKLKLLFEAVDFFPFKDELYMYDLLSGKEICKFQIEIGSILSLSGRKKDDFVIIKPLSRWFQFKATIT
jgi:prolyl oligopeptidase